VRIQPSSFVVNSEKPEKFNEFNFKRCLHKILFYVTTLKWKKFLLEILDKKFKVEVADMKKLIVKKILDFKMVYLRIVISQVQEFQLTLHDIYTKNMFINESFQVTVIIEKLSPSWNEFKNYL